MNRCTGQIRQMRSTDLRRVADIWLRVSISEYAFVCEHTGQTSEQFWGSKLVQMIPDTLAVDGYVIEVDGQIAGFTTFDPTNGYIYDLFADFPYQHKGIVGPVLINLAKSLRPHIWVTVYQKKVEAIGFYESQGFLTTDIRPPEPGTHQIKVKMEWWKAGESPDSCHPQRILDTEDNDIGSR